MNKDYTGILYTALESLNKNAGLQGIVNLTDTSEGGLVKNIILELTLKEKIVQLSCIVKSEVLPHHINEIKSTARKNEIVLLISGKISEKMKISLRENKIAYLDTGGNFYFEKGNSLILIDGLKIPVSPGKSINRLYSKSGVKFIYNILADDNFINLTYREMAQISGISLGNITTLINGLYEAGFLPVKTPHYMKVTNRKELINAWIYEYTVKLKPKLYKGTFSFTPKVSVDNLSKEFKKCYWSGEPAADILFSILRPQKYTMYTGTSITELLKSNLLFPDSSGNIEVYETFWKDEHNINSYVAPPLIIYADLMTTGDQRNIIAGEKIYNEYLQK